jgi:ubiquinone/menaquinone biosynthesis C-methylase UbiE
MPFPDNTFDILFMGWVLAYSKDQAGAVREVIRVLKPGGIAIVASDFSSEETHNRDRVDSTHMQNSDQMLALFGNHVAYVFARHDPEQPHVHMIKVAVEIRK